MYVESVGFCFLYLSDNMLNIILVICIVSLDFVEVENTKQKMKKLDTRLQHCDGKVIVEKIYDRFTTPNKLIKTKKNIGIMDYPLWIHT